MCLYCVAYTQSCCKVDWVILYYFTTFQFYMLDCPLLSTIRHHSKNFFCAILWTSLLLWDMLNYSVLFYSIFEAILQCYGRSYSILYYCALWSLSFLLFKFRQNSVVFFRILCYCLYYFTSFILYYLIRFSVFVWCSGLSNIRFFSMNSFRSILCIPLLLYAIFTTLCVQCILG